MNKCLWINKENIEKLDNLIKGGKSASSIVNEALELYFNSVNFDCAEVRKRDNYGLVVFRVHKEIIRMLKALHGNFNRKEVNIFVMFSILRAIKEQSGRQVYPDRFWKVDLRTINQSVERLLDGLKIRNDDNKLKDL